jgi:hypothetical protein
VAACVHRDTPYNSGRTWQAGQQRLNNKLSATATRGWWGDPKGAKSPLGIRDGTMLMTRPTTQEWPICAGPARGGWHRIGK